MGLNIRKTEEEKFVKEMAKEKATAGEQIDTSKNIF